LADSGAFRKPACYSKSTELARLSDFFVIAPNSSFTYKGKAAKVQDVGRELGVMYVLEGEIQKSGNQVRLNVQLVEARADRDPSG